MEQQVLVERRNQGTQVAGYPGVKQAQALGRV